VYVDQQTLKLQEAPEAVPTGEMPRSTLVTVERGLVDRVSPGARVSVLGVLSLFERSDSGQNPDAAIAAIRIPYLKVVGIEFNIDGHEDKERRFTPAEEDRFVEISRRPDVHSLLAASIAPSIQGEYTLDIKKALACQLVGGCRKTLPDGLRLRGDINVLLLGDPSTAKSQFLKFVEKVAPVGVYTSGKGSSAAGLTASVIRDKNREFFLEGGAMVLADGGICCIDEFDKMRETDRVAIHEAMEQQTISIAKAGITTVLNSRTSVLAAANPVYGRYDDLRSTAENIDMMSTILSRFDCIFIVRDIRDESRDLSIARHVMGVHMKASNTWGSNRNSLSQISSVVDQNSDVLDLKFLKEFVAYCRMKCSPRLNNKTSALLSSEYVAIRDAVKQRGDQAGGRRHQAVPVTVRQLEALVRLAESLAKMRLEASVKPQDVHEALRIFKVSTMTAASTSPQTAGAEMRFLGDDQRAQIQNAEQFLKQRILVGTDAQMMRLLEEGVALGHTDFALRRALNIMSNRAELVELEKGRRLRRLR
jgi:DNA replication licensing factor MCM5